MPAPASAPSSSSFIAGLGKKFSSKDSPAKEEEKPKEEDEGFFRGWFKKDNKEREQQQSTPAKGSKSGKTKQKQPSSPSNKKDVDDDDSIFKKVQSALPRPPDPFQSQKNATLTKGSEAEESPDSNLFGRIQGLFSKNATSDDDGTKRQSSEGNATNLNPLSSFQKLFALDRFSPVEEWITVFPKTRIMPGQIVPVTIAGLDLLVVASRDGRKLYCIVNSCPHLGTPLETGTIVRLPREPSGSTSSSSSSSSNNPLPGTFSPPNPLGSFTEKDLSNLLSQDGCEDCIVCPLHRTAFALESGDVRGEWCPYPPILGNLMGNVKKPVGVAVFDIRTRGKFVQVRLNTPLPPLDAPASASTPSR
jgi:nitrite reductase/ring-hydroxylating ferredoxin subunit